MSLVARLQHEVVQVRDVVYSRQPLLDVFFERGFRHRLAVLPEIGCVEQVANRQTRLLQVCFYCYAQD